MPKILVYLYTSGSTENQKEWYTTAGYMVYTAYTFKNVFNYEEMIFFGALLIFGLLDIPIFLCSLY
jgi:acyl-coenzyme A synthetase/AMP-(fatty) acid ligase